MPSELRAKHLPDIVCCTTVIWHNTKISIICIINLNKLIRKKNKRKAEENVFCSCLIFLIICGKNKETWCWWEIICLLLHHCAHFAPRAPGAVSVSAFLLKFRCDKWGNAQKPPSSSLRLLFSWVDTVQFEWYLALSDISHRMTCSVWVGVLQFPLLIFDYFDKWIKIDEVKRNTSYWTGRGQTSST